MRVYFDTSVLVAALLENHPHHGPARSALLLAKRKGVVAAVGAHGLAELYAVLTRAPFTPRIFPSEARQLIEAGILPLVEVVALSAAEYRQVIHDCALEGWTGGAVYDAIHIRAARKHRCERLYTLNVAHFRALAADDLRRWVTAP